MIKKLYRKSYEHIENHSSNWIKGETNIDQASVQSVASLANMHFSCYTNSNSSQYQDVFIYDLECYLTQGENSCFEVYCVGFTELRNPAEYFRYYKGSKCIKQMLDYIDGKTKPIMVKKNGKIVAKKRDIYMYAHNGKKFDSFIVLQQRDLKFISIVKSAGGILQLQVSGKNCVFNF